LITADPSSHDKNTPTSMKLSPVKKVLDTPNKGELLEANLIKRLPYVCPYCLVWFKRPLKEHLFTAVHANHICRKTLDLLKKENKKALKDEMHRLAKLGRRRNNVRAFTLKDRPIIPAYRPGNKKTTQDRFLCQFCWTPITMRSYETTHGEKCIKISGYDGKLSRKQEKMLLAAKQPIFETEDEELAALLSNEPAVFREIFFDMKIDRLKLAKFCVKEEVARHVVLDHDMDKAGSTTRISRTRSIIRMLHAMISYFREIRGDETLSIREAMQYNCWHQMSVNPNVHDLVSCCAHVCGRINKETGETVFKNENDVMNFSSMMKRVSSVMKFKLHYEDEIVLGKMLSNSTLLKDYLNSDVWKLETVRPAARQKAEKRSFNKTLVPTEDLKYFLELVEKHARSAISELFKAWKKKNLADCKTYAHLVSEALGIAIGTFSYRRLTEPYRITKKDHNDRPDLHELAKTQPKEVQESSAKYIEDYFVIFSPGKSGKVLSIVKTEWLPVIELMLDKKFRQFVGISDRNNKVFFTPRKSKVHHPNASRAQKKFADLCEGHVKNHKILRSINFRATFATNMTKMDVTYAVKHAMCTMLGHSMEVHERSYEIPQALTAVQLMGFACMASATNTVQEYASKKVEHVLNIKLPEIKEGEDKQ
jgi:hypothetical protein